MSETRACVARRSRAERPPDRQFLDRAEALVALGWCQQALARDHRGRQVEPWSVDACSWSPLGALTKVWYERRDQGEAFEVAYEALALATGGRPEEWNGARWRTKRHALNALARAREHLAVARRQVRQTRDAES